MIITPAQPRLISPPESFQPMVQKGPYTEASSQTWLAFSLVQLTGTGASVVLQRCAADATAVAGLAPQAAVGTASNANLLKPPFALFGTSHYPFDLRDVILEVTISNASLSGANIGANGVTWAGGGTSGVALAPGQQYGLITLTSGTYSGYQFLDVTETTAKIFEIVALAPWAATNTPGGRVAQATTDNNPRVWVKMMPASLQG